MKIQNNTEGNFYYQVNTPFDSVQIGPGVTELTDEQWKKFGAQIAKESKLSQLTEINEPLPESNDSKQELNEPANGKRGRKAAETKEDKPNETTPINE